MVRGLLPGNHSAETSVSRSFSSQSSFPLIHKVGNIVNFVLLHSEGQIHLSKKMGIEPATPKP